MPHTSVPILSGWFGEADLEWQCVGFGAQLKNDSTICVPLVVLQTLEPVFLEKCILSARKTWGCPECWVKNKIWPHLLLLLSNKSSGHKRINPSNFSSGSFIPPLFVHIFWNTLAYRFSLTSVSHGVFFLSITLESSSPTILNSLVHQWLSDLLASIVILIED